MNRLLLGLAIATALATHGSAGGRQAEGLRLEGAWRLLSYVKADTQVRYKTDGYMMFSKTHWTHVAFFNRDPRERDFSEAHHGTYRVTGPDTLVLEVDMELHMDPKSEFQKFAGLVTVRPPRSTPHTAARERPSSWTSPRAPRRSSNASSNRESRPQLAGFKDPVRACGPPFSDPGVSFQIWAR